MTAKLTTLIHKIAIQLHLVAESCAICSSSSGRPVRKLLDTPLYSPYQQGSYHYSSINLYWSFFYFNFQSQPIPVRVE